eukprot:jgi/Astpho2/765/fgenesh1_pg.00016_%23_17_t
MATDNEALVVAYLRYKPTFGLAVAAFVLFVLVTSAVTVLICTTKRCRWMLIVTLSGACEAAGYLCRVIFIKNATYGMVLIVITPTIFACADYELAGMNLYRVIEFAEPGGYFSKLATTEAYLFAFDCLLMLLAHAAWIPLFPAFYLPHYEATLINDGVPPPSAQQLSITANSGAQRNGATVMQQPHDLEKGSKQSTC